MIFRRKRLLRGVAAVFVGATAPAWAQNVTNEAWIGQTGETNTISIIQAGVGNSAGANASDLSINQIGRHNEISIDQLGWANSAGAETLTEDNAPTGINQSGDRNRIDIGQGNTVVFGGNSVGAVHQSSVSGAATLANDLFVRQADTGGDGGANHRIGFVTQINDGDDPTTNTVDILQLGGAGGTGNEIGRLVQIGQGNLLDVTQTQLGNLLDTARQQGDGNQATVQQGQGVDNTIGQIRQIGDSNHATITQSGERNYVSDSYQNNEGVAISGNTLVATIAGNDNGGDGLGGVGAFGKPVAIAISVYQGAFTQIGDDNDIRLTVNGGSENLYGIAQNGQGNGAIVAISRVSGGNHPLAERNEVAVVQEGDDNNLSIDITGDDNAAGVVMEGDRNQASLFQNGNGNAIVLNVAGDDNNNTNLSSVGSLSGSAATLAADLAIAPGRGLQDGGLNTAMIYVTGDANLYAFRQAGDENIFALSVNGAGNQSITGQSGDFNSATVKQSGTGNSMAVRQF